MCDKHKVQAQEAQMQRFKSARLGILSENLDINKIKQQHDQMLIQQRIGAFGGKNL